MATESGSGVDGEGDLVLVASYGSEVEAELAAGRLRSVGIEARRTSVELHRWTGVPSHRPHEVSVRREDVDRASALLADLPDDLPEEFRSAEVLAWSAEVGRRRTGDVDQSFRSREPRTLQDGQPSDSAVRGLAIALACLVGACVVLVVVGTVLSGR